MENGVHEQEEQNPPQNEKPNVEQVEEAKENVVEPPADNVVVDTDTNGVEPNHEQAIVGENTNGNGEEFQPLATQESQFADGIKQEEQIPDGPREEDEAIKEDEDEKKDEEENGEASPKHTETEDYSLVKPEHQPKITETEEEEDIIQEKKAQQWFLHKIKEALYKFDEQRHWKPEFTQYIKDFLNEPDTRRLFFWIKKDDELYISTIEPPKFYDESHENEDYQVSYFLKKKTDFNYRTDSLDSGISVGLVDGDPLDDLLNKMNQNYLPKFLNEQNWPEGLKKEFTAQLHKFMATLTEASHLAKGTTTLYIPVEDLSDPENASKDKDLIQRLESTVIHWTRQIKEVVMNQDSQQDRENAGPLDEIKHWRSRTFNLSFIYKQLEKPELKRIIHVLELCDSSYLRNFKELATKIEAGSKEANDNLKFLSTLQDPCIKIESAEPKDIPTILPDLLNRVRMIWELSEHYNTFERISGLLTKISNQIIKRCREKINIEDMLDGDVEKCMRDLDESINCGNEWKDLCLKNQELITKYSTRPNWDVKKGETIFDQIDAFVQRCRDLKEICEGQLQFARKGSDMTLPNFGGAKGPEITANLFELERAFKKHLNKIRNLDYNILDIKMTKWHEDYTTYKNSTKDLEIMFQNMISIAFKSVSTVQDGVEMLENFDQLAKRPSIKDFVQKKAGEYVFNMFIDEIKQVEDLFESQRKKTPPMPLTHPKFGGIAIWTRSLVSRLEKSKEAIDTLFYIGDHPKKAQALDKYIKLLKSFDQHITITCFKAWCDEIEKLDPNNMQASLERPVLIKSEFTEELPAPLSTNPLFAKSKGGFLESNFDKNLLKLLHEVTVWNKLQSFGVVVPHTADKMLQSKEQLRILRENVMLIVRDYNNIIHSVNAREKAIFSEHLRNLDKAIEPGMKKLKWNSNNAAEMFVRDCRRECYELSQKIARFKENMIRIQSKFKEIADTELTSINKKKLYDLKDFLSLQKSHQDKVAAQFAKAFDILKENLVDSYELFIDQGPQVQLQWLEFIEELDKNLKESLIKCVKNAVFDLARKIRGDTKTEPITLFKIYMSLDPNDANFKIILDPTYKELEDNIHKVIANIIGLASPFPRIEKFFRDEREKMLAKRKQQDNEEISPNTGGRRFGASDFNKQIGRRPTNMFVNANIQDASAEDSKYELPKKYEEKPSYHKEILDNSEIKEKTEKIAQCVQGIQVHVEEYKKHKILQHSQRLSTMRSERGKKRVFVIKTDYIDPDPIQRYKTSIETAQEHMTLFARDLIPENIKFVQIDPSKLKQSLIEYGNAYQIDLLNMLFEETKKELNNLYKDFNEIIVQLKTTPTDLHQLKNNMDLYAKTVNELPKMESKIDPIKKKFEFLEQHEVTCSEEEQQKLKGLRDAWKKFNDNLTEANQELLRAQRQLKAEVENSIDDFTRAVQDNKRLFSQKAPYDGKNIDTSSAKQVVYEFKEQTRGLREREEQMKFGLSIFEKDPPTYVDLIFVEKELQLLNEIWSLKESWDDQWESWRSTPFRKLPIQLMDEQASKYQEKLKPFEKDCKSWGIYDNLKSMFDQFRHTMPLIIDISNNALEERHWDRLKIELKVAQDFDPESEDFNLEEVFKLSLPQHHEIISVITEEAMKQQDLKLELQSIEDTWKTQNLDLMEYKAKDPTQKYYKIQKTEKLFEIIEENVNKLSIIKSSPYLEPFKAKVEYWESTLSNLSENIEMLLQVQRQWSYMESIFHGQKDDMAKQLPNEASTFERINATFKTEMDRINKDRNALRACTYPNFYGTLMDLNKRLDYIQKMLDQFLENKRMQFPRFYFLSNDDLLEILGQSKDLTYVLKHIKKCFEGIQTLEYQTSGARNQKIHEVVSLVSPDRETIKLHKAVPVERGVETWMDILERRMFESLQKLLYSVLFNRPLKEKREQWVKESPGQLVLVAGQVLWTADTEKALMDLENGSNSNALRNQRRNQKKFLDRLVEMVRGQLTSIQRLKVVTLITVEVHNRDVLDKLYSQKIMSPKSFEWKQQLRYERKDENDATFITVRQTNTAFPYGYEYQGNNGRLVVTPLTDRCYMTLTNALFLRRGGAPQGPAGTGKTETVKDLGKNLAKFVLVFNCSDSLDYKSLGRMFSGLAQTGAWGCFDEFNRIEIEVLSVVAQQISSILDAIKSNKDTVNFEGAKIRLNSQCGIFITMNPGYAGRTELPDNLKSLFRPVAMMVPDFVTIAEIMLMAEGFSAHDALSRKVVTIYDLMRKQLSKQDHYDFGMRAVKSVLTFAGKLKREKPDMDEHAIMMQAIKDMNIPKFVAEDVPLFQKLFLDLFPGLELADPDNTVLVNAIEYEMTERNLQLQPNIISKCLQLFDSQNTRHGNMLVGQTMSGKSTCWKILKAAMNNLYQKEREELRKDSKLSKQGAKDEEEVDQGIEYKNPRVREYIINPKSITIDELYGYYDSSMEWNDGILSSELKSACEDPKKEQKWFILDGPVDTLWIESMNSVLDDNKILTLNNGDRIGLTSYIRLLFEVENLAVASPATVSRAGMIYLDIEELGWRPYVETWISMKADEELRGFLEDMIEKYLPKVLKVKRSQCKELVSTSETNGVMCLCKLFDMLATPENGCSKGDEEGSDQYWVLMEKWFVFSLIWSVGASVEEESRKEIDYILRDIESIFPHQNTIYEYFINSEKMEWAPWEERLQSTLRTSNETPAFHKILIQTVDTVRNRTVVQTLIKNRSHVLLAGHTGVGKTALIQGMLSSMDEHQYYSFTINFSAQSSSNKTQDIIESRFEKRSKNKLYPPGGKRAICFVDDLNMPRKDKFGSQPPLELLRQWMDYGKWYDRSKLMLKEIIELQLIGAMGPPGGGRADISKRLQSKFHLINFTIPNDSQIKRIYQTIASLKFAEFDEEIKQLSEPLAQATINLFKSVMDIFLPTPTKSHYVFNMRDISKVFQGIYKADKNFIENKEYMLRLWAHEVLRVFHDRLISEEDRTKFKSLLDEQLGLNFSMSYKECQIREQDTIFVDFLNENRKVYEEVAEHDRLRQYLLEKLHQHNSEPRTIGMDLVLFKDAISHVCRIYRILQLTRGHALLVGVGGSGRHSLTRLAAYVSKMQVMKVEITRNFDQNGFREFLKKVYENVGTLNKNTVFLFSDNEIVKEGFLEDVNNILSSGEVPNLFNPEELAKIREDVKKDFRNENKGQETGDSLLKFYFDRAKDNLHVVICLSPIGETFRNYCRMYPALINNTTIDWFMKWPQDALTEVAQKFIGEMELPEQHKASIAEIFCHAHLSVVENANQMYNELKRMFYVTPTNYIELVKGYNQLLKEKRREIGNQINKLRSGLNKLEDARKQVVQLTAESEAKKAEMSKKQKVCEELMIKMSKDQKISDEQQKNIELESVKIQKEREECEQVAMEADQELKKAMPSLMAAEESLEKLDKKFIVEVRSYSSPPEDVATVMYAVMVILGKDPTWMNVKKELADVQFVNRIKQFDKDAVTNKTLKAIEKYTKKEGFNPEHLSGISMAGSALCAWVRSIEDYSKALRVVEPKRAKRNYAIENLRKKEEYMKELQDKFKEITDRIELLNEQHESTNREMVAYKQQVEDLQEKIDRGDKLITGLAGEKSRWESSLVEYDEQFEKLVGDCLLSAAFMSYCGPFPSEYRDQLLSLWVSKVNGYRIPSNPKYEFSEFLAGGALVREWNMQGLPSDKFSTENGVLVTKGLRWPLMIDPQSQAKHWIQNMEGKRLVIVDSKSKDYMRKIEDAIIYGKPILLPDIGEELDPTLEPVLNKSIKKIFNKTIIKLGDKEIEYNEKFKFYLTTRMNNPHYTPEISTKVTLVNFTVKESGLEEQLLGIVVQKEEPNLEKSKNDLVVKISTSKRRLIELEDEILKKLSESDKPLLENLALIQTLQSSKEIADDVKQKLEVTEQTMKRVDDARENYRKCGNEASLLFFVLYDLNQIDPMYQFSLEWYIDLFKASIDKSKDGPIVDSVQDRIKHILKYHRLAVYKSACRSLFEKHKLLLSLQIAVKLCISSGEIDLDEWTFFLRGGQVMDRSQQPINPAPEWISQNNWDNITQLEIQLPAFMGIVGAITHNKKEWHRWYMSSRPEEEQLPSEWETKCEEKLKKMIVLRCLRPDRVVFAATSFVKSKLDKPFVENRPNIISEVIQDSKPTTPVIFVLSPGVDPLEQLQNSKPADVDLECVSLGQGQSERASNILFNGAETGAWVYLANCHLSISWLPELESLVDTVLKHNVHENFRLFLSSNPHPRFPISLLQRSIKMTTEPPKGIKSNMMRMYSTLQDSNFTGVIESSKYRKMLFGLCWFHTILIERKKFKTLGWNVMYDFNDSDFAVCEDLISYYMGRKKDQNIEVHKQLPWQAIQYLIAEANYGGRVTDEFDRRLLKVYSKEIFTESLIADRWKPPGTEDLPYIYPEESNAKQGHDQMNGPAFFTEYISNLQAPNDDPKSFGQHINAEITSQIGDTIELLDAILSLQPRVANSGEESREVKVARIIAELLENMPQFFDIEEIKFKHKNDTSPIKVVLLQELQRYNILLDNVSTSLIQLDKGIKGLVVISPDLESILHSVYENKVPVQWLFAYPTLKPLSSWFRDLNDRITFFRDWAYKAIPNVFWISAFTYPTGFTTALMQRTARRNGVSIDSLTIDYIVTNTYDKMSEPAKDGAYITGLFLEGAKWSIEKQHLIEPEPMELTSKMPVIQLKPIQKRKNPPANIYECPCYYYPLRGGKIGRDSYMMTVDLKTGEQPPEFWIKRGTALLMSLPY